MPTISVIVPVYRAEAYIHRCVQSILNQSYTDIELILVDDGSPDGCGRICDDYAKKDSRVKVLHKSNGGQSDAQNEGIKASKGEYITFVDSDDHISRTMLETLLDKCLSHGADVTACSYATVSGSALGEQCPGCEIEADICMTGIQAMQDLLVSNRYFQPETWGKLYKAALFTHTGICFPAGRLSGDQYTTFQLLFHSGKVVFTRRQLYYYTRRSDSITGALFSEARLAAVDAGNQAVKFVKDKGLPLEEHAWCFYVGLNMHLIIEILKDRDWRKWKQALKQLRLNTMDGLGKCGRQQRHMPRHRRLNISLLRLGCWVYVPVRKIWSKIGSVRFGQGG